MHHNGKRGVVPTGTLPSIFCALSIGISVRKIGPVVCELWGKNKKFGGRVVEWQEIPVGTSKQIVCN